MSWGTSSGTIQYGTVASTNGASQFTLSYWDRWAGTDISQPNWEIQLDGPLSLVQHTGDESRLYAVVNTVNGVPPANTLPADAWNHVCLVFDGSQATAQDRLKYYVNGVAITLDPVTFPTTLAATTAAFKLKGGLGEARLYAEVGMWAGTALSAAVVSQLAAGYKPSLVTPVANHYLSLSSSANANAELGGLTTSSNAGTYNAAHPTMQSGSPGGGGGGTNRNRVMVVL